MDVVRLPQGQAQCGRSSDILLVRGDWVYDSAHQGWNELHPIKDCLLVAKAQYQKDERIDWDAAISSYLVSIGKSGPPAPDDWKGWVRSHCDRVKQAHAPLTVDNQQRPENKWVTHPVIDGCKPEPAGHVEAPLH